MFKTNNNKIVEDCNNRANKSFIDLFKSKKLKNAKFEILIYMNIGAKEKSIYVTPSAKKVFNLSNQTFIKASIL